MSVNKYRPHILVLPEDDANREIVNGFLLHPDLDPRVIEVLPPARGWSHVVEDFIQVHVREMRKYPKRRMVLLVDFDQQSPRLDQVKDKIPRELIDKVFVLGVFSKPERLKGEMRKSFEEIGKALAQDCTDDTRSTWEHDLLRHNEPELDRMDHAIPPVRQVLFPGTASAASTERPS